MSETHIIGSTPSGFMLENSPISHLSPPSVHSASSRATQIPTSHWHRDANHVFSPPMPEAIKGVVLTNRTHTEQERSSSNIISVNLSDTIGSTHLQEACLLQHFAQNLAPSVSGSTLNWRMNKAKYIAIALINMILLNHFLLLN